MQETMSSSYFSNFFATSSYCLHDRVFNAMKKILVDGLGHGVYYILLMMGAMQRAFAVEMLC
jgi:hypothetical protein